MISIANERLIPLREAPKHLPVRANGKRLHVSAFYRWITRGVRGVVLESVRVGGTIFTSIEAIHRFVERLSGHSQPVPQTASLAARQRRIDHATLAVQAELGMLPATNPKA